MTKTVPPTPRKSCSMVMLPSAAIAGWSIVNQPSGGSEPV